MRQGIDRCHRVCPWLIAAFAITLFSCLAEAQNANTPTATLPSASTNPALASPAVDHTLYRDGEVRRLTGTFGAWTAVCDEVTRLKQRVCSLHTFARAASGAAVAALTVSTGDDGRPAALMKIPRSWIPGTWVEIAPRLPAVGGQSLKMPLATGSLPKGAANIGTKAPEPSRSKPPTMRLRPVGCDQSICTLVWSLPPAHIKSLNAGESLEVRYFRALEAADMAVASLVGGSGPTRIAGTIEARGFVQAISAAVQVDR